MLDQKKIIADLTRWIDTNISAGLTMEQIVTRSGYSKWHIQRMFSRVNQVGITAYIRNRRLETAAEDLVKTRDSVCKIAYRHGFSSQQAFTRAFNHRYDITPSVYRDRVMRKAAPYPVNQAPETDGLFPHFNEPDRGLGSFAD